jgi:DNA processing protein
VIDADELAAWLRLLLVPGLGREGARRLLAAFGSPQAVIQATEQALATVVGERLAIEIRTEHADLAAALDAVQRWRAGGEGRHLLTLGDTAYPRALLESPDPPLLLHVQGDLAHLSRPSIAVVGSRQPTPQGADNAHAFAHAFGAAGYAVVSGLALGVDGAAHEGALASGAPTIAVVGTGLDRVYPKRHLDLARRIARQGALVSEFLPGTPPLPENFPQRNRIIAGLSLGTVVVEAALRSGSLITARLANEAGREVFAVPGSIHAEQSRGCHALIRDGARLVESAAEVLDELRQPGLALAAPAAAAPDDMPADAPPDALLDALGHDPVTLDSLQARTGWPTAELLTRLLDLELDGRVARLPGGLYQRRASA